MSASTRQKFRAMLKPGAALILPGVANALAARVVADCGFDAAYITGAGIANSFLGIPDNGLVTLTELTDHVVAIREVFAGPLMVDAEARGGTVANGQGSFLSASAETFRLLTGQVAPAEVMRSALAAELGLPEEGIAVVGD